jgi:hypothetical protein
VAHRSTGSDHRQSVQRDDAVTPARTRLSFWTASHPGSEQVSECLDRARSSGDPRRADEAKVAGS